MHTCSSPPHSAAGSRAQAPGRGHPGRGEGRAPCKGCRRKLLSPLAATPWEGPPPCGAGRASPGSVPGAPARPLAAPGCKRRRRRRRRSISSPGRAAASGPRRARLARRAAPPGGRAGGRARSSRRLSAASGGRGRRERSPSGCGRRGAGSSSARSSPRPPPPIPPSRPRSEHSMSERSEDDVGAFSNPVSLGCCCRRNREKATRRKSNGDTGSQSAQSGGVSGQTLVLLDRRRQITLLRQ